MTVITDADVVGHDVLDEKCKAALAINIGGNNFYYDYLSEQTLGEIAGSGSDYGIWTAVSKGGTRQTVKRLGTPGANEVVVDSVGRVICPNLNDIVYCRYVGRGRRVRWFQDMHTQFNVSGYLDASGGNIILHMRGFSYGASFRAAQVVFDVAAVGATMTMRFAKDTGAGDDSDGEDVTLLTTVTDSGIVEFTDRLKYHPGEKLVVSLLTGAPTSWPRNVNCWLYSG